MALLLCRHDGAGAARRHQPAAPRDALFAPEHHDLHDGLPRPAGWPASAVHRPRSARDGEVGPDRGLGRQPGEHPGQRDDPHRRAPGRSAARSWWSSIPYRTGTAQSADQHLALRPGTDGALACAVMHVAFRDGYADRAYMARYADCPDALEAHLATPRAGLGRRYHRAVGGRDRGVRAPLRDDRARLHPRRLRFLADAQRAAQPARGHLPADGHRRLAARRRRRVLENRSIYHWDKTLIEGLDVRDPSIRDHGHEPHRRGADRRPARAWRRSAGDGDADPEHQSHRRSRPTATRCAAASCATICSCASTSSS